MSLGWLGAGGFAALFTARNAPPGWWFHFPWGCRERGAVGCEGDVFLSEGGFGVEGCVGKGFWVLPVASREWWGGQARLAC